MASSIPLLCFAALLCIFAIDSLRRKDFALSLLLVILAVIIGSGSVGIVLDEIYPPITMRTGS